MTVKDWTFLLVGLSFALYIAIALLSRARSTREFYVAGGHVPPIVNGMATAADWMSAASFISMAGLISFMGYDGAVYLMGWTGGYVLLALLLAPYLRKFGAFTVPDFVGDRNSPKPAGLSAVWGWEKTRSEPQSREDSDCRLRLEKKKNALRFACLHTRVPTI